MGSTFPVRRGSEEFVLCRRAHDAGASAIRFRDTSALAFIRSCVTNPDVEHKLRLWILSDPRPAMELGDDENLFEHVARRITTGQLFVAKVDTESAGIAGTAGMGSGTGILRAPPSQTTGKSKKSKSSRESTPLEDEMARRASARQEAEEVIVLNQQEAEPETTWIEIVLVDPDGKPAAGERYKLTLPDGTVQWGNLDSQGKARVERLQPGNCQVTFPDRDQEVWDVG
jgi:hypothetical protein